ncbi:ROK family protein [Bacillus sp. UNC41MFS5]|nr:ROK family protein [Bacillus sp. UNC41MFS5]
MKKYLSFDIGGSKIKHGLLLENGTILSKDSYKTMNNDLDIFLKDMVETIKLYKKNNDLSGVAISLPGFINPKTGYSERGGAITALDNQNLKKFLEKRFSLQVEIENDGNCAALAEKISGNAKNCTDFICVVIGTGIAGGIFVDGKILNGHSFRGGEIGFIITQTGKDYYDLWNHTGSTSALIHSYKNLKGIGEFENIKGETVFKEAAKSNLVRKLLDDWIKINSYGIFNLVATLNPQKILIGGGVSAQPGLIDSINDGLDKIYPWRDIKVPVESCKYQNDAGMIGAMYHLLQKQGRLRY